MALLGANIYTKVKNGIVSASSIDISRAEKRPNEAKNGILEQKKLYQDQPQSAMGSRAYPSPKQVKLNIVFAIGLSLKNF